MEVSRPKEFLHSTYIRSTEEDEERSWITGMTLVNPCKLILADSRNFSVKLVDVNSYCIVDQLQLSNYPLDVTAVTVLECAVTVPVQRTIQFINVDEDTLSLTRELEVDGDCRGISCYGENLVVAYSCPSKVQIMDLNGKILNTVIGPMDGLIFSEPYYVIANKNCIFVSDQGRRAVIALDWFGEVIHSYKCEGCPHGLTMLENGFMFVSGLNIYTCNRGNVVDTALNDLNFPCAVCWCNANRKLFVSYHKGDEHYDDYVQVFEKQT
ncbi:uncharacterized protein LOC123531677 [Mercenaria mercenaria]|uniref:uncharacterized protein LOC123531677 n=1 Tax=Mercenaria mercenaria TaxID=6596 RepID=UPI00234F135E|nr:uncharacterized protein LOC123531677 [Mercenaria mercenaria]